MKAPAFKEVFETLNEENRDAVLHFAEFLKVNQAKKTNKGKTLTSKQAKSDKEKRGGFGSMKGFFKMTKDFDAPLESFREYMP